VVFGLLLMMTLIGAVNYSNNPGFLVTFLLAGMAANTIFLTWRNLLGLRLRYEGAEPVFAGDPARLRFRVDNDRGSERPAIQLGRRNTVEGEFPTAADLPARGSTVLDLNVPTQRRGRLRLGRLVVSTYYPLGLFYAWCYLDTEAECLVYPRPSSPWTPPPGASERGQQDGEHGRGIDDFVGLRNYRSGDPPKHLHWRALARGQGLLTKEFGGEQAQRLWLAWDQTPGSNDEERLSRLCRALLDAENSGAHYGLTLPRREIAPDRGRRHLEQCLRALALFGEPE
jgi:uncharacterized protein (DUF58 family)